MITFSDGISFQTEGPLRLTSRADGWYIVGRGLLCPVESLEDGRNLIDRLIASDPEFYNS